jgi:preprotein translocase subunit SecF
VRLPFVHAPATLTAAAGITALAVALGTSVSFDANLLRLQAEGLESVDWELKLIREGEQRSWFAASLAPDLETARDLSRRLETLDEVDRVESLADLVPPDQAERSARARSLAPLLEGIDLSPKTPRAIDLSALERVLDELRFKIRDRNDGWTPGKRPLHKQIREAHARLTDALQRVRSARQSASDTERIQGQLGGYQDRLMQDFYRDLGLIAQSLDAPPVRVEDIPAELRARLRSDDGKFLVRIFAKDDIWDDANRDKFVEAIRTVDPHVTGGPVQVYESSRLMLRGYIQGGLYALGAVLLVLVVMFRRLRHVVLTLLPLVLGGTWTVGAMMLTGQNFNLANLVMLPLIIGVGIDVGIHMVHRYREDGRSGWSLVSSSTGRAAILSALTTIAGFGALAVARHRGIHSLGVLLGIGLACVLFAALLVLAPALRWVGERRGLPRVRADDVAMPRGSRASQAH